MESVEDEYVEQVVSPRSSSPVNHFEDPQVLPRIGNEYQAEIPPLIAHFDYLKITNKPADSKAQLDLSNYFSPGLPIPWRNCEVKKCNGKLESGGLEQGRITLNKDNSELKVKHRNPVLEDAKNVEEFSDLAPTVGRGLVLPLESNMKSWSKLEEDSFLLCLYIFGKNLRLVKRFIGSKEMGDILSFYYGTFYTSDGYRRWSECRKLKSRRCIHGKKIFTGWRRKELVSRLIPHVSKECQDMLMEIGPNQLDDHMESVEDEYVEQVVSPRSSSPVNHFEDPQVLPRIGNEYQAEIPPLIAHFDYLKITNKPADSKAQLDLSNYFSPGLPIPWRNCEVKKCNGKLESGGLEQGRITLNKDNSELKVKHRNPVLEDAKNVEEFSDLAPTVGRGLVLPLESNMKSWSKLEEDSFLLCLYIFGKNLRLVKRFIGSKEMGDILSFYYGTFYTSDGYRRWSECRKLKSRRCIHGKKIFTGWRRKELVSRLIPHVSKECQDMLMEIGPNQLDDHMESVEDEYVEQVVSPRSSSPVNHFEDPQVLPRIGNEYQAEIPPLIAHFDYLKITNKPADSKAQLDLSNYFSPGLPIPWRNCEVKKCNGKLESGGLEQGRITLNKDNSELKVKHRNPVLEDAKNVEEFSDLAPTVGRGLVLPLESNMKSWSKLEEDSFLLCLYIFGKNLRLVKRFIGSKEMGDILSFYYGTFYTSDGYRRWSECRKLKSRRCIHGKKIFTGWRRKELVSRLIPHVSKECQDMLMESSRYFVEGKISFEEYIFKLKDTVGIHMLIEAVGIGKGKQDLTGTSLEPIKNNHVISFRPEVPIGKACSSLTASEIIKFLTGNFRLSKARMNDLFWEAVWPRLLARGWHSEQPKLSLVFLVPGIEKFSRSLVKGNQYFDSVSDVLKNVASNSGILELDNEPPKGSESEDRKDRWDLPKSQGPNDLPNKQHHHYLLPRSVNGSRDLRNFTIVDTSMLLVAEKPKVRELRSLHVQTASLSTLYNLSSENEQDTSKELEDYAEETNTSNPEEDMIDREAFVNSSYCVTSNVNTGMPNTPDPALVAVENHESQITSLLNHESQRTSLLNDKCPSKIVKDKFSRKLMSGRLKYLAPITRQKDLTDCKHGESSCSSGETISVDRKPIQDESHPQSNLPNACEVMEYQVDPQHFSTASSLEKGSPSGSNEGSVTTNCLNREGSPEKSQPWTLIDLNLPPVSPDLGTDEPLIKCMMQNNDNSSENKSSSLSETSEQPEPVKLPEVGESMEQQQPAIKSQRQSTRNRPLTTRAWEALELDFCRTKRKRKGETLQNKSTSRLQIDRGNTSVSSVFDELQDRGEKRVKSL